MKKPNLFILALLSSGFALAQQPKIEVKSNSGNLSYNVSLGDKEVITDSPLGLNLDNQYWGENINIKSISSSNLADRTYTIERKDGSIYYLETKEFKDGVALRYRIPSKGPRTVYSEQTSFTFPEGSKVWYSSGPFQYGWLQEYQERNTNDINDELLAPPSTFLLPNGIYAAITEGNLFDFHGAVLFGQPNNRVQLGYVENEGHLLSGRVTGMPNGKYAHSVVRHYPWIAFPTRNSDEIRTPWRILMIGNNLNELVNNTILEAVSEQADPTLFPKGKDTEWIKPGRSGFLWLTSGGTERLSVANHKKYIDGASELGIESVIVDDGWELWASREENPEKKNKWQFMKELVDYGKDKNVDIWVWRPSSPRYGNMSDVGLEDPDERKNFMRQCTKIGVKGLKIDFLHTENVYTVQLMEEILKDAAKEKLMVVFHGVNKPTGDSYTYPNLMAKEAVRGLETVGGENSWAPGPPWPYHNTVLPFTRWLVGPADYTPLNYRDFCHPSVTFAHQLSSIYMLTSPMLIFAADIEDMLNLPGREFIEEVPVIYDENYVLKESEIGEVAAIARRKGDIWYLTILNGEKEKILNLSLDFLDKGTYKVTEAVDDNGNRKQVKVQSHKQKSSKKLKVNLLSGGGYLAKFEKL